GEAADDQRHDRVEHRAAPAEVAHRTPGEHDAEERDVPAAEHRARGLVHQITRTRAPWNERVAQLSMTPLSGGEEGGAVGGRAARGALIGLVVALVCAAMPASATGPARPAPISRCDWPMWGQNVERPFAYPCPTELSPQTAQDLKQIWFFNA